jgi:IS5 family transposase
VSAVRAAVEHVFARQKGPMGLYIRTIGLARARAKIGLANLVYNLWTPPAQGALSASAALDA